MKEEFEKGNFEIFLTTHSMQFAKKLNDLQERSNPQFQ
jgi:hypothetical protein